MEEFHENESFSDVTENLLTENTPCASLELEN